MKFSAFPFFLCGAIAVLVAVPEATAARRSPNEPIVIAVPPGGITTHMEVPSPSPAPTFGRTRVASSTRAISAPPGTTK